MANLWSFFGLPDPDGSVKKQKKATVKKPENSPPNELTTNSLTQQTIVVATNFPLRTCSSIPHLVQFILPEAKSFG